jgi:parvulin-like peptidyl-prolyl isomerase
LAQEGKTVEAYKRQILRPQLLRLKVLNVQVRSRVSVREDEIKALYQQNLRSLGVETRVRARHIFLRMLPADSAERRARAKALAQELLQKIEAGEAFAELARRYSEDALTREDGGDLGFFGRGTLPPNVEDEVFAMQAGEVRGPIRSGRGLHLIELVERRDSGARPYEQVQDQLRNQLYNQKMERATKAWIGEVRKRSYIDTKL